MQPINFKVLDNVEKDFFSKMKFGNLKSSFFNIIFIQDKKTFSQKLDSNINIIDPSAALIKKFNESFAIPKTDRYESISFENVRFFVTSERDEFSNKVKFWLGINKEIRLVNLRRHV